MLPMTNTVGTGVPKQFVEYGMKVQNTTVYFFTKEKREFLPEFFR